MWKGFSQRPQDEDARRRSCSRIGNSIKSWCAVWFVAIMICSHGQAEGGQRAEAERDAEVLPLVPVEKTLTMTEAQFDEFQRQRASFRDLPWFRDPDMITGKSQQELRAMREELRTVPRSGAVFVELPDRLVAFSGKRISLDLEKDQALLSRLAEAIRYYPEIQGIFLENLSDHTDRPELAALLEAAKALPHLSFLNLGKGTLSRSEAALLAKCASVRRLELVDCRISSECFAEFARLRSLEELAIAGNSTIGPECFVTLARLPHFRSFYFNDPDPSAFNGEIDETTRRAIESLNGRLEEFLVEEDSVITIHPSIVRALLSVKSLRHFEADVIGPGLTFSDVERLEGLTNLVDLSFGIPSPNPAMNAEERSKADVILVETYRRVNRRWEEYHHGGTKDTEKKGQGRRKAHQKDTKKTG